MSCVAEKGRGRRHEEGCWEIPEKREEGYGGSLRREEGCVS